MIPKVIRALIATDDGREVLVEIEGGPEYVMDRLLYLGELVALRISSGRDGRITYQMRDPNVVRN